MTTRNRLSYPVVNIFFGKHEMCILIISCNVSSFIYFYFLLKEENIGAQGFNVLNKIICVGDGKKVMIDVENKTGPEILDIVGQVAGATET